MPPTPPDPVDALYSKMIVPSPMKSVDWDIVPVWTKERVFFSACDEAYKSLAVKQAQVANILSARSSRDEARRELRKYLNTSGYQPAPGTEGTIKDMRSLQRLKITLDTNVDLLQGYTSRQQAMGSLVYPAQRFERVRASRVPRDDWEERWQVAAAAVGREGVAPNGDMVALVKSPIWAALSRFGTPYPPFDYGSGMGVKPVRWEDAKALGLIPNAETAQDIKEAVDDHHLEGLNRNLEASGEGLNRDLRDQLAEAVQGFGRWEGDVLKFTDPNGDRPLKWQEAADVICADLPEGFAAPQREAIAEWVKDSSQFNIMDNPEEGAGLNMRESVWRAINRIIPTDNKESGTIYRGLKFNDQSELVKFMDRLKSQGYGSLPSRIAESWSTSEQAAVRYASSRNQSAQGALIVMDNYKSGKRIDGVVRKLNDMDMLSKANVTHPHTTEGEILFLKGTKFKVTKIDESQIKKGGNLYVHVTEV